MKTTCLLILLSIFRLTADAQDKGIMFHHGTFTEALAKAKKENKLIFMDAYTVWCGPCKYLAKNVFMNDTVGRFFNENFICVKMDMEKGEGIELAKKYEVSAYPTLLYLNGDGEMVHRTCGVSYSADATQNLINDGKNAMDPLKSLAAFRKKHESGSNDAAFIFTYLKMRQAACLGYDEEVKKYLATVPEKDLVTRSNWNIIYWLLDDVESPQMQYMIDHRDEFYKLYTKDSVDKKIYYAYNSSLESAIDNKNEARYNKLREGFIKTGHPDAERTAGEFDMHLYKELDQHDKYASAAQRFIDKYAKDDDRILNEAAWHFYEVIDEKTLLKKAAEWSKRSIEIEDNYAYNDTYAALQYKLGNKQEAMKFAKKAIEIAKKSNEDYKGTEELLKKIEKMK